MRQKIPAAAAAPPLSASFQYQAVGKTSDEQGGKPGQGVYPAAARSKRIEIDGQWRSLRMRFAPCKGLTVRSDGMTHRAARLQAR
jgi:hypothetical protein